MGCFAQGDIHINFLGGGGGICQRQYCGQMDLDNQGSNVHACMYTRGFMC